MNDQETLLHFDKFSEKLKQFYAEVLGDDLPHAKAMMSMMIGDHEEENSRFVGELSGHNIFKDSIYEYKGQNDFLHFTSAQSLVSILNHGYVRAAEFRHLTDRNELAFASKAVDIQDETSDAPDIEALKQTIFSLSMCEFDDSTLRDQFMWLQYANASKGVSVRFKLHRPDHENFATGKVIYGEDNLDIIKRIVERAKTYRDSKRLFPSNFRSLILPILAYHKVGAYSGEKEIRLLFKHEKSQYEKHKAPFIIQDINSQNNLRYFNQIFLHEKRFIDDPSKESLFQLFKEHSLTIEITDIYFGRNIDTHDVTDFHSYFAELKQTKGYNYKLWRLSYDNNIIRTY